MSIQYIYMASLVLKREKKNEDDIVNGSWSDRSFIPTWVHWFSPALASSTNLTFSAFASHGAWREHVKQLWLKEKVVSGLGRDEPRCCNYNYLVNYYLPTDKPSYIRDISWFSYCFLSAKHGWARDHVELKPSSTTLSHIQSSTCPRWTNPHGLLVMFISMKSGTCLGSISPPRQPRRSAKWWRSSMITAQNGSSRPPAGRWRGLRCPHGWMVFYDGSYYSVAGV